MPEKCVDNCPLVSRVEALESANKEHSNTHREIFRRVGVLETQTAVQENKLDTIISKQDTIVEKLEALESKPGKKWETLVACLISSLATLFIGWIALGMPGANN